MVKVDVCKNLNKIIKNQIEKFLSNQRETYSIIKDYFDEKNVDFKINDKVNTLNLEELLEYIDNVNTGNLYSDDVGYNSLIRLKGLVSCLLATRYYFNKYNKTKFTLHTLEECLSIIFNREELNKNIYNFLGINSYDMKPYFFENTKERNKSIKLLIEDINSILFSKAIKNYFAYTTNESNRYYASSYILIYFNQIQVTNENNLTHTTYDTYIKIDLLPHEIIDNFTLARAAMSASEYKNNYSHSHANCNNFEFGHCCLGSGPINETVTKLKSQFIDSKKYLINVFCFELENYLKVESLAGVPYHKLQELSKENSKLITNFKEIKLVKELDVFLVDFYKWILNNHHDKLFFVIDKKKIILGMSLSQLITVFTNLFNQYIEEKEILKTTININKYFIKTTLSSIGYTVDNNRELNIPNNKLICIFKENNIFSSRIESHSINEVQILNPDIIGKIINEILTFLNINYE